MKKNEIELHDMKRNDIRQTTLMLYKILRSELK